MRVRVRVRASSRSRSMVAKVASGGIVGGKRDHLVVPDLKVAELGEIARVGGATPTLGCLQQDEAEEIVVVVLTSQAARRETAHPNSKARVCVGLVGRCLGFGNPPSTNMRGVNLAS